MATKTGQIPKTINRIMPGIRKSVNGDFVNKYKGIWNRAPEGEIINTPPPNRAPIPRNNIRNTKIFLNVL
jgi:hypothetical protein